MSASEMERLKTAIESDPTFAEKASRVSPTRDAFIAFAKEAGYDIIPEDFGWKQFSDADFQAIRTLFSSKPQQSLVSSVQYC